MDGPCLSRRKLAQRGLALAVAAGAALPVTRPAAQAPADPGNGARPFSFERLIERTRQLAGQPYAAAARVPEALAAIPLPVWERIRFLPEARVWGDQPSYRLSFPFPGAIHREPVRVSTVEDGLAHLVPFRLSMYDLAGLRLDGDPPPETLGFAGLKVHYPLVQPGAFVELLSFLGASFFRAVGRGTLFGASARALTLNTGLGRPEEFPAFRQFWVQRPAQPTDPLTIYALLDSPSVAGAFRFDVVVREATRVAVDANLFFRVAVEQVGVAPISGMFLHGSHDRSDIDDWRPQVHAVEGLAMWTGRGDVLWRPVVNPSQLRMSIFTDESPRGFGLLQRTREPRAFQDAAARFDLRPNLWVEPRGAWGKGSIRLIEVPTAREDQQNIVAFWTPAEPLQAGQELRLAYSLAWSAAPPIDPSLALVRATRVGAVRGPDGRPQGRAREVVLDLTPPAEIGDVRIGQLDVVIGAGNSRVSAPVVSDNPIDGGWRVAFTVEPSDNGPVELRAVLRVGERTISETWLYRLDLT
jgi:glucans biosynthesis protein